MELRRLPRTLSVFLHSPWKLGAHQQLLCVFRLELTTDFCSPDLTWRDIQHLCIKTARIVNPSDPDWEKMASGQLYSYKYGFGALDAWAYVKAAQDWALVKPQAWIHTKTVQFNNGKMFDLGHKKYKYEGGETIVPGGNKAKMTITKEMLAENNLEALEHVEVRVWISHTKRGDVQVELVSPNGIRSVLAGTREFDEADTGFPGWRFMTLKHWYVVLLSLVVAVSDLAEGVRILSVTGLLK